MHFREACNKSKNNRAKRTTEEELWIILDPDCRCIIHEGRGFGDNSPRRAWDDSIAEVFKLIATPDGIEYEKVRHVYRKEIEEHDDWTPIIAKDYVQTK